MATIDEIFATMPEDTAIKVTDNLLVIDPNTRKITVPNSEIVFGVEHDNKAERKYFQSPRIVGNNIDLTKAVIRVNYKNANGEADSYIVTDLAESDDVVVFSWEISEKAVRYKGVTQFLVCVSNEGDPEWHTTLATGTVLEGLEPDVTGVEEATSDVIAQLVNMVEAQTAAVQNEGAAQVEVVKAAAEAAEAAAVAEIEAKGVNTRESIPADYAALSEAVDSLVRSRAGAIVCDVEGSVISISDASDNYVQGLRVFGRSTQDGTPTPEAPVEIVSVENPVVTVCGKNLFNIKTLRATQHDDGGYLLPSYSKKNVISFPNGYAGQVTISGWIKYESTDSRGGYIEVLYTDGTNEQVGVLNPSLDYQRYELTTRVDKVIAEIDVSYGVGTVATYFKDVQVEFGTTASAYEPYSGQTLPTTHTLPGIPVTSGGNYTDENGQQWICDEVDLARGVYVSQTKLFDLSSLKANTWYTWGVSHSTDGVTGFYHFFDDDVTNVIVLSNIGQYSIKAWGGVGVGVGIGTSADGDYFIVSLPNEALADTSTDAKAIESFLAFIADTEAVILAAVAPVETPLSETELAAWRTLHTNKPNTTILNDCGARMAVSYAADTKLYIDNKIAALVGG